MRVVCVRTGKSTFGTFGQACSAARGRKDRRKELRPYRCEFCGFFHLSTHPYRPGGVKR